MSEKLVTQYDFLTNVVRSAGEALGAPAKKKLVERPDANRWFDRPYIQPGGRREQVRR